METVEEDQTVHVRRDHHVLWFMRTCCSVFSSKWLKTVTVFPRLCVLFRFFLIVLFLARLILTMNPESVGGNERRAVRKSFFVLKKCDENVFCAAER